MKTPKSKKLVTVGEPKAYGMYEFPKPKQPKLITLEDITRITAEQAFKYLKSLEKSKHENR